MNYVNNLKEKKQLISNHFKPYIGKPIMGYEIAEVWSEEDKDWSEWMDVPLFLNVNNEVISISWQKFNELGIQSGRVLPFSLSSNTVRWKFEGVKEIEKSIGQIVSSVSIGRGDMELAGNDCEIWTRLLIEFESGDTLEVFNALDENGFVFHTDEVCGEIRQCI